MRNTVLVLLPALALLACGTGSPPPPEEAPAVSIEAALESVAAGWVARDDIHAVYQSKDDTGRWILKVIASGDSTAVASSLPAQVQGYRVVVEPGDPIEPLGG